MEYIFSDNLINLAKAVKDEGHTLYLVGGAVRNMLMGLPIGDIDICGDMSTTDMLKVLKKLNYKKTYINEKYGTVKIAPADDEAYEYTTFRIDKYDNVGNHMPIDISFTDDIDIDTDRRDFDINAIYYDLLEGTYHDKYSGMESINNKVIKGLPVETPVLSQDGQRLLRLIRLSNELGFKIDKNTHKDAVRYAHIVKALNPERRLQELKSIVVSDLKYTVSTPHFLEQLNKYNLYEYLFNSTLKNLKLKLTSNSCKNYYKLQKESRFIGFAILVLEASLNYRHHNENLILYVMNNMFGLLGLKCSNEDMRDINKIYILYQDLEYGTKQKDIDLLLATKYATLSTGEKDILSNLVSKDKYRVVTNSLEYLRAHNLPTSLVNLDITPSDLIESGIRKEFVSKLMDILFKHCLLQDIKNEHNDLLQYALNLNKEMEGIIKDNENKNAK